MQRESEITAVLTGAVREVNSRDGNPVWSIQTDRGTYMTEADAQVGHDVPNRVPQTEADAGRGWVGREVVLTVRGRADRVIRWRLADAAPSLLDKVRAAKGWPATG